jgi:hypothetical protein
MGSLSPLLRGATVEIAMVGNEGMLGIPVVLRLAIPNYDDAW